MGKSGVLRFRAVWPAMRFSSSSSFLSGAQKSHLNTYPNQPNVIKLNCIRTVSLGVNAVKFIQNGNNIIRVYIYTYTVGRNSAGSKQFNRTEYICLRIRVYIYITIIVCVFLFGVNRRKFRSDKLAKYVQTKSFPAARSVRRPGCFY